MLENHSQDEPFSWKWVFISLAMFIGMEVILGVLLGYVVVGRYVSLSLRFLLQGLLNLASYFVGGFLIGVISPRVRVVEPAVGAFFAVAATIFLTLFTCNGVTKFKQNHERRVTLFSLVLGFRNSSMSSHILFLCSRLIVVNSSKALAKRFFRAPGF